MQTIISINVSNYRVHRDDTTSKWKQIHKHNALKHLEPRVQTMYNYLDE